MKRNLWLLLIFVTSLSLKAQGQYSVRGTVVDTSADLTLLNASVSVLNSKDSTLVRFTRAAADGSFSVNKLHSGKFILLITYPKYADYVEHFSLDSSKKSIDVGRIGLLLKSQLLADVIIKGKVSAIKIKGDTTEYNAGSFVIEANSKVEDLLRQLPGIQVDKDGKITAQGETVNKVLVDGEEFFGDDPTLVTKNLRADMVDKVQLYDKKSAQATFTGIDDGEKTKTINIKLKEDKKNGYFGKVDGGSDSDYYQGQAMFNAFKAKRKISAYATLANTGTTGLSWQDGNKYGATSMQFSDEGYMYYSGGRDELSYNGEGIPSASTGGAHYDAKWNNDRESINTNYKVGALTVDGKKNNLSQTSLPGAGSDGSTDVFNSTNGQSFSDYTFRQKLDATYEIKVDSVSNLKLVVDGTLKNSKSNDIYNGETLRGNNNRQNISDRKVANNGSSQSFFASAFYNHKLKKVGRTYSMTVSQSFNQGEDEGFLNSHNRFYFENGEFNYEDKIDQLKLNNSKNFGFNSNVTYTEPLTKSLSVVFNGGINLSNNLSDRKSLNRSLSGEYDSLDTEFSNKIKSNQVATQGGAVFNLKKGKMVVNFGTKVNFVDLEQHDLINKTTFERNFVNLIPQASYQYKFSQYRSFRASYLGSTRQPSIGQIQPVRNNTDPLNIWLGNPELEASFRSSFSLNYNAYKVLSQESLYAYGSYSFTANNVTSNTVRDTTGRSTYQYLNLGDKMPSDFYFRLYFRRKVEWLGFNVGLNLNTNGSQSFNYINNVLNTLRSNRYSGQLTISNYVAKKYSYDVSFGPSYNTNKATLQTRTSNNGAGFSSEGSFRIFFPGKLEISSNYNYNLTKRTETFNEDVDFFILNTTVSKKFFKNEGLKLSVSGNDLLNQNIGFSRRATDTSISQNSYTTIRRFYLVALSWDFNKMGGGLNPQK